MPLIWCQFSVLEITLPINAITGVIPYNTLIEIEVKEAMEEVLQGCQASVTSGTHSKLVELFLTHLCPYSAAVHCVVHTVVDQQLYI
jgi:hypothetical protein